MSQGDEESGNAPTIVTATAVNVDKGYAGGPGQPGHGGNSGVPVVVAQPWSVQGQQYGQMLGHPGARQQHVAVQQQTLPNGRNVVTFATLNQPYGGGGMEQQLTDREAQLIDVYRLSRFVRNVSMINIFFTIISGVFSYIYFFFLPFPICGYWGAKAFNNYFLYIYIGYLVLEAIFSLVLIVIVNSVTFTILRTLYIIFNFLIIRYTARLCTFIAHMTDEDREFLHTNALIVDSERSCC